MHPLTAVAAPVICSQEFAEGHAPGASNIPIAFMGAGGMTPNPDFAAQVQAAFPDKSEALVVGCKSGGRSTMAVGVLTGLKYTNTVNMTGGFVAWLAAGLPVDK